MFSLRINVRPPSSILFKKPSDTVVTQLSRCRQWKMNDEICVMDCGGDRKRKSALHFSAGTEGHRHWIHRGGEMNDADKNWITLKIPYSARFQICIFPKMDSSGATLQYNYPELRVNLAKYGTFKSGRRLNNLLTDTTRCGQLLVMLDTMWHTPLPAGYANGWISDCFP